MDVPLTVYEIKDVPAVSPVTTPEELIVPTAGDADAQVPPAVLSARVVVIAVDNV